MTIHLSDGVVLDRIWVHAYGVTRQIKEVHTKTDGKIWGKVSLPEIPLGTHAFTPAKDGSAYGYYKDTFGILVPSTLESVEVEYLQVLPNDKFRIAFAGNIQLPGVTAIELYYTGAIVIRPVVMYWIPEVLCYESAEKPEGATFVRNRVDEELQINLVAL